jgi:hypothetical protein
MIGSDVEMGIRVCGGVQTELQRRGRCATKPTNRREVARPRDHRPHWRLPAMDPDPFASPDTETALTQSTPDEVLLPLLPRI